MKKNKEQIKEDQEATAVVPVDRLKMIPLAEAKEWYEQFVQFSRELLKEGRDFGIIPGVEKPSLLKPGAEKLRFVYQLQTKMEMIEGSVDQETGYVDYTYRTTVMSPNGQMVLAECEGSCNSYESKYLYRLSPTTEKPDKQEGERLKAEGKGRWRKQAGQWVWMDRVKNGPEALIAQKNTIQKMAQKRAFVGAMLLATGASEFFTQDVEDMGGEDVAKEAPKVEGSDMITPAQVELISKLVMKHREDGKQYQSMQDFEHELSVQQGRPIKITQLKKSDASKMIEKLLQRSKEIEETRKTGGEAEQQLKDNDAHLSEDPLIDPKKDIDLNDIPNDAFEPNKEGK